MAHPDMHDVIQLYQAMMGPLTGGQRDKLYQAHDEGMEPFVLGCAILYVKQEQRLGRQRGGHKRISFNYLWAIIEDWMVHGLENEEVFRAYWEESLSNRRGEGRGDHEVVRRNTRKDYQYTEAHPPPKGFFAFLDD